MANPTQLRGTPRADGPTPAANTSAGLTPQMSIINGDGTPSAFFFRWLLNSRAAAGGQTPWLSDIDAAGFDLNNLGGVELDAGGITFPDGTTQTTAAVAGGVTGVTASAPLASSGGPAPNITIISPLPVANGGSGSAAPSLVAGANVTITGAWPNQTIAAAGGGTGAVSSVFGRVGAVVAAGGDYTVAQVTGAVASSRQIIAGAGLTGGGDLSADRTLAVNSAAIASGIQTPWLQNIDAAGFQISNIPIISAAAGLGLLANGAGSLVMYTKAANQRLVIDSAGHVTINPADSGGTLGIGTAAAFPLDIIGVWPQIRLANAVSGAAQIRFVAPTAGTSANIQFFRDDVPSSAMAIGLGVPATAIGNDLVISSYSAGWTERVRITNAGNVGIGTYAPGSLLTIIPSSNLTTPTDQIVIGESTNNTAYRLSAGFYLNGSAWTGFIQATNSTPAAGILTLQPLGGKVGIGTAAPGFPLDVAGAIQSGSLLITASAAADRAVYVTTAGSNRWYFGANSTAESGGNAGSDFAVNRCSDSGGYSGTPFFIQRSTGNVGLGTTAPSSLLHLSRSVSGGVGAVIMLENPAGALSDAAAIRFLDGGNLRGELRMSVDAAPYGADLIYYAGLGTLSEKFRVTQGGNVSAGSYSIGATPGYTGTLASASGRNVLGGIIV